MFDPSSHDKPKGTRSSIRDLTKPGTYMLGITKAQEHGAATKSGKRFTKFRFVVLDGPEKGASFFDRVWRNPEALKRLASYCYAIRDTSAFNPDRDAEMEKRFVGRAMMADVEMEEGSNGKEYARVKFPLNDWTGDELATMREWEKRWKESAPERERRAQERAARGEGGGRGRGNYSARDFRDDGASYGNDGGGAGSSSGGDFGDWGGGGDAGDFPGDDDGQGDFGDFQDD